VRPAAVTGWLAALALTAAAAAPIANADPSDPSSPSRSDVREARHHVQRAQDTVASVRAALASANDDLNAAEIASMQAAEAYNGALLRAQAAKRHERAAERASRRADRELARQKEVYGNTLLSSYDAGAGLDAVSGLMSADGLDGLIDRTTAAGMVQDSLQVQRDDYRRAADAAADAAIRASDAADTADDAADQARQARDDARSAADLAESTVASIADRKDRLLGRLAHLQGVSVRLARQRQEALEQQQREDQQEQQAQQDAPDGSTTTPDDDSSTPADPATPDPGTPATPPAPDSGSGTPPAPSGGAAAAVAFARAQLGEPYVWAADGPDSWDCSGLTMGAWAAGGKSLPHYSVAQYAASTPISRDQLQPGDLVFWSSSSSPSSIFHVALYVGDGMIIHAPRPGRGVSLDSIDYWIPPTFYARP